MWWDKKTMYLSDQKHEYHTLNLKFIAKKYVNYYNLFPPPIENRQLVKLCSMLSIK